MIGLAVVWAVPAVIVAAYALERRHARRAAAARAELRAHLEWSARMRAAAAGEVVLLDAHRAARRAVERESLAADIAESERSQDV